MTGADTDRIVHRHSFERKSALTSESDSSGASIASAASSRNISSTEAATRKAAGAAMRRGSEPVIARAPTPNVSDRNWQEPRAEAAWADQSRLELVVVVLDRGPLVVPQAESLLDGGDDLVAGDAAARADLCERRVAAHPGACTSSTSSSVGCGRGAACRNRSISADSSSRPSPARARKRRGSGRSPRA